MDVRNSFKEPAGYLKTWDEENLMYGNVITALPVWSLCPARPSQEVSPVRSIPLACKNTIKKGRTRQHSLVSIEFKGFGWSAISNPIWLRELRLTKSIDAAGFIMCNAWYCQVVSSKNRDAWIPAGVTPCLWYGAGMTIFYENRKVWTATEYFWESFFPWLRGKLRINIV